MLEPSETIDPNSGYVVYHDNEIGHQPLRRATAEEYDQAIARALQRMQKSIADHMDEIVAYKAAKQRLNPGR
jgi:cell fate (sporulation/competence/biofilm development) regulator YlbF (YheA/YmcA/DUF963 family)